MKAERTTGVIRTLPYFGSRDSDHTKGAMGKAYKRMMRTLKMIEAGTAEHFFVAFPNKPVQDVLHCYLNVGGKIRVRANISHWIPGEEMGKVVCWDDSERHAKWWAVVTGPISWPPHDIVKRGTQGFRYTSDLW